ncbi:MAG: SiaC family regulatory phosphoprotein [Tenuifilaceae bacterium]|nr:SiaC family regulatory phosphoprotein [Tenuifilaceae bacterium]
MDNLLVPPSFNTPLVYGNSEVGKLLICGKGNPNDVMELVIPTEKWINSFLSDCKNSLVIHLDLNYINNPISLMITGILRIVSHSYDPLRTTIFWHYNTYDDDMFEIGDDYADWVKCSFNIVKHSPANNLSIAKSETSPLVYIDTTGDFLVHGASTMESPMDFYRPIVRWLSDRLMGDKLNVLSLNMHLTDVSPSSEPFLKAMVYLVDAIGYMDPRVTIEWCYSNQDIERLGEECLSGLSVHYRFKHVPL